MQTSHDMNIVLYSGPGPTRSGLAVVGIRLASDERLNYASPIPNDHVSHLTTAFALMAYDSFQRTLPSWSPDLAIEPLSRVR
jgi:hypothetical protein